jgi:hypothetical protein
VELAGARLIEVVRPHVERHVLALLGCGADSGRARAFSRREFRELPDGTCRLLSPLTHELAEQAMAWSNLVAPFTERIVNLLTAIQRPQAVAVPVRPASLAGSTIWASWVFRRTRRRQSVSWRPISRSNRNCMSKRVDWLSQYR